MKVRDQTGLLIQFIRLDQKWPKGIKPMCGVSTLLITVHSYMMDIIVLKKVN